MEGDTMALKICPKCKKILNGNKVCNNCGENVGKYEKIFCAGCKGELVQCPKCGTSVDMKHSKCSKCGYDMEKARTLICTYCDTEQITGVALSEDIIQQEEKYCTYCGSRIGLKDAFCPKCGRKIINEERYCSKCGAIVYDGQRFCTKCGNMQPVLVHSISKRRKSHLGGKKIAILIIFFSILIADFIFLGKNYVAPMFVTTDQWLEEGNYEKAYSKADDSEEQGVLIENLIAYLCKDDIDYMNDAQSFNIRKAWIDINAGNLVLMVGGNNQLGASIINLWYYRYQEDERKYTLYTTLHDLDEEEIYYWDDADDMLEKFLDNYARERVRETMQDHNLVEKKHLKNINKLAKTGKLSDVKLLNEVKFIYPTKKKDI